MTMTPNAQHFYEKNQKFPVIAASVMDPLVGGKGGAFTLLNTWTYGLTADELRSLPDGFPRWAPMK